MPSVGGSVPAVISGFTFTTKTAAYTAAASEYVLANASSTAFTVTLPVSPSTGTVVGVKKTDSSANVVTVVGSGATTIDKDANCTLNAFDAAGVFVYDGSNWQIQATVALNAASAGASSGPTFVSKSVNYTANAGEYVLAVNAITVTLPASPATGAVVGVRKQDYTTNVVTIAASQSIDGGAVATGYQLSVMNQAAEFEYDGTVWRTIRNTVPGRVSPSPIIASAAWYDNRTSTGASNSSTGYASSTYYMPYYLSRSTFFQAMAIYLTAAAGTGGLCRLGVHAMNPANAQPAGLLYDYGTVASTTTGFRTVSGQSAFLQAGWIFLSVAFNTASQTTGFYCTDAAPTVLPNTSTISQNAPTYYYASNDGTPTFVSNPTSASLQALPGPTPLVWFQSATF